MSALVSRWWDTGITIADVAFLAAFVTLELRRML